MAIQLILEIRTIDAFILPNVQNFLICLHTVVCYHNLNLNRDVEIC